MKKDKILFIDTETGGIDPDKHSLLSLALVVWQEFKIIDSIEILINDGLLNVTKEALAINKIDIDEHKKNALSINSAVQVIDEFLNDHFDAAEKITLAGHNVNFDVNFFKVFLSKSNYSFNKKFSHRFVDTSSILYYLYLSGKLKEKAISSQQAFDLFGIKVKNRHTALSDAVATAKLFSILLKIVYKAAKMPQENKKQSSLFEPSAF